MLTPDEQDLLVVRELRALCETHPTGKAVAWRWGRFRTTAGTADFNAWCINLNRKLLNTEERLLSTLRHEYAHLLAVARKGRDARGHGEPWEQAMRDVGEPIEVKHKYECTRNQPRQKVWYRCARCGAEMPRLRRLPKRRKYMHSGCGGAIQFVRIEPIE